jgi:hypothetical protein
VPGALLTSLAVAALLAAGPLPVSAATLIPGGGSPRTDCIMQMSVQWQLSLRSKLPSSRV